MLDREDRQEHHCTFAISGPSRDVKPSEWTVSLHSTNQVVLMGVQIRAAEDLQTLIRYLQEMWLFGQLNTIGESEVQQQTDENAKTVAALLKQLAEKQGGLGGTNGHAGGQEGGDHTMTDRDA